MLVQRLWSWCVYRRKSYDLLLRQECVEVFWLSFSFDFTFFTWTWCCPLFNLIYWLCFFADFLRHVHWIDVFGINLCPWILIITIILNCCWLFCSHQKWADTVEPSPLLISATIIRIIGIIFFLFNLFLIGIIFFLFNLFLILGHVNAFLRCWFYRGFETSIAFQCGNAS